MTVVIWELVVEAATIDRFHHESILDPVIILGVTTISAFAVVIASAIFLQPKLERSAAASTPDQTWNSTGFSELRPKGFDLWQVVPTSSLTKAEFYFRDEFGQELGRYSSIGRKSGDIVCRGRTLHLYIQGSGLNRTIYSGKVGGSSNNSIVIRDDERLIAEIWRTKVLLQMEYRIAYQGKSYEVRASGWRPTAAGTIETDGIQIGTFRRPRLLTRNILVAFQHDLPAELKCAFCSLLLLN